jgi:hypothetical protein
MVLRILGIIDLIMEISVPLVGGFVPFRRCLLKGKVGFHSAPSCHVSVVVLVYPNVEWSIVVPLVVEASSDACGGVSETSDKSVRRDQRWRFSHFLANGGDFFIRNHGNRESFDQHCAYCHTPFGGDFHRGERSVIRK